MSGILRLESLTKGNTLKQGDKTPLKYRLFDADGEKLNIAGKSAVVRLMYPDFLRVGYESETLTVSPDNTVTFIIDKVIQPVLYHLEITVDGKYIFPSRNDESKFNIDKSSQGSDAVVIEIIGKDVLVRDIKNMVDSEIEPVVNDMIVSNQKVLENEQVVQEVNILSKQLEERQNQVEQFNNQVITEMTDKDVISAPEILGARGGFDTLGARLDETTSELADKAKQQFVDVTEYGAKGDGVTDDSEAFIEAVNYAVANKKPLLIPETANFFNLRTFQTDPEGGRRYAVMITGDLKIICYGKLGSTSTNALNALFKANISGSNIEFDGLASVGSVRYDLIRLDTPNQLGNVIIKNCKTERQNIIVYCNVENNIICDDNEIGINVLPTDTDSPALTIYQPTKGLQAREVSIRNNIISHTHHGNGLTVSNLGNSTMITGNRIYAKTDQPCDAMDLDGVGQYGIITNNIAHGGIFELKGGSNLSSDVIFSNNISINSNSSAFSLRTNAQYSNLLAWNPKNDAFFFGFYEGENVDTYTTIANNLSAYFGVESNQRGVRINTQRPTDGLSHSLIIDGLVLSRLPSAKNTKRDNDGITILGASNNLTLRNVSIRGFTGAGIRYAPTNGAYKGKNFLFENIQINDVTGYGLFFQYGQSLGVDNVRIKDLKCLNVSSGDIVFQARTEGKSFRNVNIESVSNETFITTDRVDGFKFNGLGMDSTTLAGDPPNTEDYWIVGDEVVTTSDNSVWKRISKLGTSDDWVKIA